MLRPVYGWRLKSEIVELLAERVHIILTRCFRLIPRFFLFEACLIPDFPFLHRMVRGREILFCVDRGDPLFDSSLVSSQQAVKILIFHHSYPAIPRNAQNRKPDSIIATGSVNTQAISRFRTVANWSPEWFAIIVPATPDDSTCVVLTGNPSMSAVLIVTIAVISAAAPCPYVRWSLPIFSPTVTTMRFQPIMVPRPSAIATATFTQVGMNLVARSICFL